MIYDVDFGRKLWPSIEVEGEFAREAELVKVIGGRPSPNRDIELDLVPVTLVPEPGNPHDKNAITVQAEGHIVGYLSRADAVRYQQSIYRITASGAATATTARIWASTDDWGGQKKFRARVSVALPEPDMMLPLNDPPEGQYNLIPWGGGVQVTKEEEHLDVLFRHVPPSGGGLLYVSLHQCIKTLKNGAQKPFVEVRVDGQRAGELTPVTSAHFLPTIQHLEASDEIPTALAKITGSAVAVQLVLQAAKAPEIPNEWFANSPNQVPKLVPRLERYLLAAKPAVKNAVASVERPARNSQQSIPPPAPDAESEILALGNLPDRTLAVSVAPAKPASTVQDGSDDASRSNREPIHPNFRRCQHQHVGEQCRWRYRGTRLRRGYCVGYLDDYQIRQDWIVPQGLMPYDVGKPELNVKSLIRLAVECRRHSLCASSSLDLVACVSQKLGFDTVRLAFFPATDEPHLLRKY